MYCEFFKVYNNLKITTLVYCEMWKVYSNLALCVFFLTQHDKVSKPYNPLLGETFDCELRSPLQTSKASADTNDCILFVGEQLTHHPPGKQCVCVCVVCVIPKKRCQRQQQTFHADEQRRKLQQQQLTSSSVDHRHPST